MYSIWARLAILHSSIYCIHNFDLNFGLWWLISGFSGFITLYIFRSCDHFWGLDFFFFFSTSIKISSYLDNFFLLVQFLGEEFKIYLADVARPDSRAESKGLKELRAKFFRKQLIAITSSTYTVSIFFKKIFYTTFFFSQIRPPTPSFFF